MADLFSDPEDPFNNIVGKHSPTTPEPPQSFLKAALKERIDAAINSHARRNDPKPATKGKASEFTTKSGIAWDKAQGWKLRHSERSQAYKGPDGEWRRRTSDLPAAMDAEWEVDGMIVGTQYGGVGEEKAHYQKFVGLGGIEKAKERYSQCWYREFVRGNPVPVRSVRWF